MKYIDLEYGAREDFLINKQNQKRKPGIGEKTHRLRALAAPLEDPGFIPSTHMVSHSCL